jgi:hypothetical protein
MAYFAASIFTFMVANHFYPALFIAISVEQFTEAITAFVWALMTAFKSNFAWNLTTIFFKISFSVHITPHLMCMTTS